MNVLLDTNVLTRSVQANHPHHGIATSALVKLIGRGDTPCIVSQVVYEFWSVATRPIAPENGLGLSVSETVAHLDEFRRAFTLFDDRTESVIALEWQRLVKQFDVKGKSAHDARLVAAMSSYGIPAVLTFNRAHFTRFSSITAISPEDVS